MAMAKPKQKGVVGEQWCVAGDREVVLRIWQPFCGSVANVSGEGGAGSSENVFNVYNPTCYFYSPKIILRDGNSPLLCSHEKCCSLKRMTSVYRGESRKGAGSSLLFTVRRSRYWQCSNNMDVFLATPTDGSLPPNDNFRSRVPDYHIKASFIMNHLSITQRDGAMVAKAYCMCSFSTFCAGKPSYKIVVYPGVDQAFIVMLVAIQHKITTTLY